MNGIPRNRAIRSQIHADFSAAESKASASMSPRSYGWCPAATMFFDSRSGSLSAATSRPSATIPWDERKFSSSVTVRTPPSASVNVRMLDTALPRHW